MNSTKPSKLESVSPCGTETCVDDVGESGDLDRSAQPSGSCGTDGERGGESSARAPKRVQETRANLTSTTRRTSHIGHGAHTASAGAERLTRTASLGTRSGPRATSGLLLHWQG